MRKVMMMTAERFMYTFIHAVRQRYIVLQDQFQSVDVLLIDDFQFLQGKAIQQEFYPPSTHWWTSAARWWWPLTCRPRNWTPWTSACVRA